MKKLLIYICLLSVITCFSRADSNMHTDASRPENLNNFDMNNHVFIENKGQWAEKVLFLAKVNGMNVWITKSGIIYDFFKNKDDKLDKKFSKESVLSNSEKVKPEGIRQSRHVVEMAFKNENRNLKIIGKKPLKGYLNYFLGNDLSKWVSHVPIYKEVEIEEIYDGIDLKFYFDDGSVRYDFIASPNSDLSSINIKLEGHENLSINENGELLIQTSLGQVEHRKIFAYQIKDNKKREIECKYEINNGSVRFNTGAYDNSKTLIIDPLVYSTFIGGSGSEYSIAITADDDGYAYISGNTASADFPVTTGAYQTTKNVSFDTFVSKINPSGTELVFSTFIGGSNWDRGDVIKTDANGNVYIIGWTYSTDYPTTTNAFQTTHGGGWWCDAVVTKLNPEGSNLEYSTYIGGNYHDVGYGGAVDENGFVYITGNTISTNFPVTTGAYQNSRMGDRDCFITKLNTTGTDIEYSTYIGGEDYECAYEIDIDSYGNAYITGYTESGDYPVTQNAIQKQLDGAQDAFVTKLNPTGTSLIYSSYLGGSGYDLGFSIDLADDQYACIAGYTSSTDYPSTQDVYQSTYGGGDYDCFVAKFNASGSELVYSTYLGGSGSDDGYGIKIDNDDNILLTGNTNSTDFPVSSDAMQSTFSGTGDNKDCYVARLNSDASEVLYSTYLGGSSYDMAWEVTDDNSGNIYVTGYTGSSDFLINDEAYQTDINSGIPDCFVTKFNICNPPLAECKDISVYLDDNGEATISADDIDYGSTAGCGLSDISISQNSFDCSDIGQNPVTLTVTDAYGNTDQCTASVTVIDDAPPDISVSVSPGQLWPPNHKLKTINATVNVSDNCTASGNITIRLVSVSSNEPDNGLGDGDKPNDIQNANYGSNDLSFDLRAERSGNGTGRTYTIVYEAEDASGNTATATAYVVVPHDQSKNGALVSEVNANTPELMLNCFPNPANTEVTFSIDAARSFEEVSITITDLQGNTIGSVIRGKYLDTGRHLIPYNISALPSGSYYYTIKSGSISKTKQLNIVR